MWDVWARRELNRNAAGLNTSFVVGLRELDGEILYLNLGSAFGGAQQHEPHTLVAGATGSGKSVLIQGLILDIAATNSSALVQIILIDPKMGVDYAAVERLPHIPGGIIVDQDAREGGVGTLGWRDGPPLRALSGARRSRPASLQCRGGAGQSLAHAVSRPR